MILWYCNINADEKFPTFEEFGAGKAEGKYVAGYLPVLYIEGGQQLAQTNSIARYLTRRFVGKEGEQLYPKNSEHDLIFKIEEIIDIQGEVFENTYKFQAPLHPEYKNKDQHRPVFLETTFPKFCETLEAKY